MSAPASDDYNTDMQTIDRYIAAVLDAKAKIATSLLAAIDNFQTTVTSASPADATPNILGTIMKAGLKTVKNWR